MNRGIWWRLAGMMVLVYGVQGAFWPLLAVHLQDLGIDGREHAIEGFFNRLGLFSE